MMIIWWLFVLGCVLFLVLCMQVAYRNGVNDGYGYSQEPSNPGYAKAGRYLRKYMAHRWKFPKPLTFGKGIPGQGCCVTAEEFANATELERDSILMRQPNGGLE